jgi:hypothetical protein
VGCVEERCLKGNQLESDEDCWRNLHGEGEGDVECEGGFNEKLVAWLSPDVCS